MPSIAIYLRISKEEREKECSDSIKNQKELLLHYTLQDALLRHKTCRIYADDGFSGLTLQRPAFQKMLADIHSGLIDTILVKDFSRLSRNHIFLAEFREKFCPGHGIVLLSPGDRYDSRKDPWDSLEIRLKSIFYESYSRDISKKVKRVLDTKKRNGEYAVSSCPFGYIRQKDGTWILDTQKADWIKSLYDRIELGETVSHILSHDRPLCPWNIYPMKLYRILHNPVYTGYYVWHKYENRLGYQKKTVTLSPQDWYIQKGTHPIIISPSQFQRVQTLLKK